MNVPDIIAGDGDRGVELLPGRIQHEQPVLGFGGIVQVDPGVVGGRAHLQWLFHGFDPESLA